LRLRLHPFEEIEAGTPGHFQIGDEQARERILNAIGINAGTLQILDRILAVGNADEQFWHARFLEGCLEKQDIVLIVFSQQDCMVISYQWNGL